MISLYEKSENDNLILFIKHGNQDINFAAGIENLFWVNIMHLIIKI